MARTILSDTIRQQKDKIQEDEFANKKTANKTDKETYKEDDDHYLYNKYDNTDNEEETSDSDVSDSGTSTSDTSGSSSTPRDKDAELKQKIKSILSEDTNFAIEADEEEINEIIEKMKKMGISKDKGLSREKIKSIKKGSRMISK